MAVTQDIVILRLIKVFYRAILTPFLTRFFTVADQMILCMTDLTDDAQSDTRNQVLLFFPKNASRIFVLNLDPSCRCHTWKSAA